ncbi:MAG: hypothetical protein JSW66_07450 [Phycisphaerales bacterium]|nr:MAG: hypothetical protein JSW66_07450 [Phycisphaerales bacterium]
MNSIDIKSLIIGLLLGLCAVFATGSARIIQNDKGRYRIAGPPKANFCVVIDTRTGHVWHRQGASTGSDWGSPDEWEKKK